MIAASGGANVHRGGVAASLCQCRDAFRRCDAIISNLACRDGGRKVEIRDATKVRATSSLIAKHTTSNELLAPGLEHGLRVVGELDSWDVVTARGQRDENNEGPHLP
ncbi:MAG: hypothetical protein AB7R00_32300 [Kofleriaceae bacterium]